MKKAASLTYKKLKYLLILLLLPFSGQLLAQAESAIKAANPIAKNRDISAAEDKKEVLDTDESLKFMGERLLFQMRKRLHLVDETELKAEEKKKEKSKDVKFSIFGITIEKD
jgi:hypothetical protein